jgi:hypothetical protein
VIFLASFIALSFKAVLFYITCFTIFLVVTTEFKSINFSILAFGITLNKAISINWLIVIIRLIIADLLALLIGSSL